MQVFRRTAAGLSLLLAVIVSATLIAIVGGVNGGEATHSQAAIDLLAVDPDIAGNTATSLGSQDICLEVAAGATVEVDVTVSAIPPDRPLTAFQFDLFYDLRIVNVTAVNVGMLLGANEGSNALPALSDPVPDSDGGFQSAALDLSASPGETGPGVLSRLKLKAVGTGVTVLSPNQHEVLVLDDYNEEIPVSALGPSYLAVGVPCPGGDDRPPVLTEPVFAPTPGPGVTPDEPDQSPTGTPQGSATPPVSTTPSGSATPVLGENGNPGVDTPKEDDGGIGAWIIAPIGAAVLALGGAGYAVLRRRRGRST